MSLGLGISSAVRHPKLATRQACICTVCDALTIRHPNTARASFSTRTISKARSALLQSAHHATAKTTTRSDRPRWLASAVNARPSGQLGNGYQRKEETGSRQSPASNGAGEELSSLTDMMAYLENSKSKVLGHRNIPSEADVCAALQACKLVADYIMDESVQPQITHMVNDTDSTASNLLSLDSNGRKASQSSSDSSDIAGGVRIPAQLRQMIDGISEASYAIIAHPTVFITPSILSQYVAVQARLDKPETLPRVFQLYASKPMPQAASGTIEYTKQNPNKASNAIDPEVIETALDTAIAAKNLDAAVGIIEYSYTTTAFIRSKLLRKAMIPMATFAATPLAAYGLAKNFSVFQDAMDAATATNVAFAGILAYVGFTASIGVVAVTTANDQMRRVTWASGIPLRRRWIREEERAALDKVACAWGFRERWRQGEEEGSDWDALREYIGQKGMVLDRTELMEGME
ncbi:hypothetical protein BJ170DRAFT_7372 [Xylariales sp. AK1849]|nr:hypothetical protein BJ170DRAFT_7372 [Xylariales sp. AK1849]